MRDFKFLSEVIKTSYNGEISRQAIEFFDEYCQGLWGRNREITTSLATYKITINNERTSIMHVYPLNQNMKIKFWINKGRVTPYIVDHSVEIL